MTVRELLTRIDSYELAEWQVLYNMDPWGEHRDDTRSALQTSYLMDIHRDRKKRSQPFQAKDFLLTFTQEEEQQPVIASPATKKFAFDLQARLLNAQTKRKLRGVA